MVREESVDIFKSGADIIIHQANCFHVMGGGIAAEIRSRFPEAYKADLKTEKGDTGKFGSYSSAVISPQFRPNQNKQLTVINLYSQFKFGYDRRYTNYEAVARGLGRVLKDFGSEGVTMAVPWKMGCNLGGGDWNVVESIIYSVFEESPVNLLICKKPELV